ncbi:MAG: hypothetical protein U0930_13270 [Pirellulales bacterium]
MITETGNDQANSPEAPIVRSSLRRILFVSLVIAYTLPVLMTGHTFLLVGIAGLLTSIGFGKSDYQFLLFAICGLLLGFVLAAAVSTFTPRRIAEPPSIVVFTLVWLLYALAFVAVGRGASRK